MGIQNDGYPDFIIFSLKIFKCGKTHERTNNYSIQRFFLKLRRAQSKKKYAGYNINDANLIKMVER